MIICIADAITNVRKYDPVALTAYPIGTRKNIKRIPVFKKKILIPVHTIIVRRVSLVKGRRSSS